MPNNTQVTNEVVREAPGVARDVEAALGGKATEDQIAALRADVDKLFVQGPGLVKEAKAGYKTTEFWLATGGAVLAQLGVLDLPGRYGKTITTVALVASYALSRGAAKAGVASHE